MDTLTQTLNREWITLELEEQDYLEQIDRIAGISINQLLEALRKENESCKSNSKQTDLAIT